MKRGTPEHPKMLMLADQLEIAIYSAWGLMEGLWHFAARYAPCGDIGKHTNKMIAQKISWDGDPDQLIEALVDCGWLDQVDGLRLYVHDWHDHSDDTCNKYLIREGMTYANGAPPRRKNRGKTSYNNGNQDLLPESDGQGEKSLEPSRQSETKRDEARNGEKSQASQNQNQNQNHTQGGMGGERKSSRRFKKPTLAEVKAYCEEKGYTVDVLAWYAHYESNGWKVGKVPMQNWKGAVVTWTRSSYRKKDNAAEESGREPFRGLG